MSLFCPKCWAKARCLETRSDPLTNSVRRRLECTDAACRHRFNSVELIPGHLDLRNRQSGVLLQLVWEIFDALGGDKAEQAFIEAWEQRKEQRRVANAARQREAYVPRPARPRKASPEHPWRRDAKLLKAVVSAPEGKRGSQPPEGVVELGHVAACGGNRDEHGEHEDDQLGLRVARHQVLPVEDYLGRQGGRG